MFKMKYAAQSVGFFEMSKNFVIWIKPLYLDPPAVEEVTFLTTKWPENHHDSFVSVVEVANLKMSALIETSRIQEDFTEFYSCDFD